MSEYRLKDATDKIELQISQSRKTFEEALQRLQATESACEVADENLRISSLGFAEGVIPVSNLNEAQTAWLEARSELIAAKIDIKLAQVHLQRALGLINRQ